MDPRGLRADAPLLDAWLSFQESAVRPFTIPGHKQRHDLVGDVIAGDVPLYGGLDSMKLADGVLADAEARAAVLWGADACRFSVGGSTHGNQALALAVGAPGDVVVVGRSAHRSMVTALVLAGLTPMWVTPPVEESTGMPVPIPPASLDSACADAVRLARDAGTRFAGVFLTDPAYVGTHGDVAAWAEVAHAHGVPLIVDAAWAAHFGFHPDLPAHALARGADALVTSAHKSLPAYSQGALILARFGIIDPGRFDAAVEATHTTSPAGSILASIDAARALLARDGEELLAAAMSAVRAARERFAAVPGLVVLGAHQRRAVGGGSAPGWVHRQAAGAPGPGRVDVDPLKLALILAGTGADGTRVEADLIAAGMPLELADRDTLIAMVTLADDTPAVERLVAALMGAIDRHRGVPRAVAGLSAYRVAPEQAMDPRAAAFARRRRVPAAAALGRVSVELIAPYPPGIPILAPGERITPDALDALSAARDSGARIAYAADPTLETFLVAD